MTVETWTLRETPKLSNEQFLQWQKLLEERTGIQITEPRKSFLETTITLRMREVAVNDYDVYYRQLMNGLAGEMEWSTLVDRLSVQETRFFRHASSYQLVEKHIGDLLHRGDGKRGIDLWSVGCATGEEPYSLAMLTDATLAAANSDYFFGVTATDLSTPAIAKARTATYSQSRVDTVPERFRSRYFEHADRNRQKVVASIRDRVCFSRLNMLKLAEAPIKNIDIIFCQNVLIYFKRWRKHEIVNKLCERLLPGGLLILGVGELFDWSHPEMERVPFDDTLAYVRRAGNPAAGVD